MKQNHSEPNINLKKVITRFTTGVLTGILCINDEAGVVEGGSLFQTIAVGPDLASVSHFGLDDHDRDWTVGDMLAVLENANPVFADLAGNEGQTWRGRGDRGRRQRACPSLRVLA